MVSYLNFKKAVFFTLLLAYFLLLTLSSSALAQEVYVFKGRGTAHGVGLDMAGVAALANQNRSYVDILKTYYTGITLGSGYDNKNIRVGILFANPVQVTSASNYRLKINVGGSEQQFTVPANEVVTVSYANGVYTTQTNSWGTLVAAGYTVFEPISSPLKLLNNGRRYRGRIVVRYATATGRLWAINRLNIEKYVYGLAEEPNDWPTEAQRTLAVAGRTYGLYKVLVKSPWWPENFDVDATLGSQYYLGYDAERPNLRLAVDDTKGQVALYNGQIIVAAYHGNSGGHTESIENVWGGYLPYLRGVPSPWTPIYYWGKNNEFTFSRLQLEQLLNQKLGGAVGTLYRLDFSDRTPSGRVRKVKIIGSKGTTEVWGYAQFANWLGLPSALIDSTGEDNWQNFILINNPYNQKASGYLLFYSGNGLVKKVPLTVNANSRKSILIDSFLDFLGVATKVQLNQPVMAERATYFALGNNQEVSGGRGIWGKALSKRWLFAEGSTKDSFSSWFLLFNPNSVPANVTAYFYKNGQKITKKLSLPAYSRREVFANNVAGLANSEFATEIVADQPIAAERAMYFIYAGKNGGHSSVGTPRAFYNWHFAEGYINPNYENYLMLFNPTDYPNSVSLVFFHEKGVINKTYMLNPKTSLRLKLNDILPEGAFSTKISGSVKLVAERSIYFNSNGTVGGNNTIGVASPGQNWFFAEGATYNSFVQFLALSNPNPIAGTVTIRYILPTGQSLRQTVNVQPASRATVLLNNFIGANKEFGLQITSSVPVVPERVSYFHDGSNSGGEVTVGTKKAYYNWYFPEGYTGP